MFFPFLYNYLKFKYFNYYVSINIDTTYLSAFISEGQGCMNVKYVVYKQYPGIPQLSTVLK